MIYNVLKDTIEKKQKIFDCSVIPNQEKYKFIADELVQDGLSHSTSSNYIFEYAEIIENYGLEENELEDVCDSLWNDEDNVVDVVNSSGKVDIIFNFSRCSVHDEMEGFQQLEWNTMQNMYNHLLEMYSNVVYNSDNNTMIDTMHNFEIIFVENIYSLAQAKKVLNDIVYNLIDNQIECGKSSQYYYQLLDELEEESQQTM